MLFQALQDAAYVLDIAANLTRNTLRREEKRDGKIVSGAAGRLETIPQRVGFEVEPRPWA